MEFKLIKPIQIITIIILSLVLFAVLWGAYYNLQTVRHSSGELDKGIDEVIVEWVKADSEWTKMLEDTDKKLEASKARLEKLGVEID